MSGAKVGNEICITVLKSLLVGFNIIFIAVGCLLMGWSFYLMYLLNKYSLNDGMFGPIIVLAIGAVITSISCCGCLGAIKQSSCLLKTYSSIVGGFIFLEIIFVIVIVSSINSLEEIIGDLPEKEQTGTGTNESGEEIKVNILDIIRQGKNWFIGLSVASILTKFVASVLGCVLVGLRPEDKIIETVVHYNANENDLRMLAMMQNMQTAQTMQTMQSMEQTFQVDQNQPNYPKLDTQVPYTK